MIQDSIQIISDTIVLGEHVSIPISDTICHSINIIQSDGDTGMWNKLMENGLTILIALVAGLLALYQVKSNIVSSARIKWIEELRQDISQLYNFSLNTVLYNSLSKIYSDDDDVFEKYVIAHSNFFILTNKIRMMLNVTEAKHKELVDLIDKVELMLDPKEIDKNSQDHVEVELKKIVLISRVIFKIEWDRSKKIFKI